MDIEIRYIVETAQRRGATPYVDHIDTYMEAIPRYTEEQITDFAVKGIKVKR